MCRYNGAHTGSRAIHARRAGITHSGAKIRVAVCDDHDQFRRGVVEMLSFADDVEVVGEASDHDGATELVFEEGPDVVLLDLEMPGMGADEAMRRMLSLSPAPNIVILTMHDEPGMVGRFLGGGATTYVPKSAVMEELVEAVREAVRDAARAPATLEGTA